MYCDRRGPEIPGCLSVCVRLCVRLCVCLYACLRQYGETTEPISIKLSKYDL